MTFDFDDWAEMARRDPEQFEARRDELIRRQIEQASAASRQRMTGLQWRIDCMRRKAGTPLAACMAISGMMWDSMLGENGLIEQLQQLGDKLRSRERPVAEIVPLRPLRDDRPD